MRLGLSMRVTLSAVLLLFCYMILAGWATDTPRARAIDAAVCAFMLLIVLGVNLPRRGFVLLRVASGMVALAYVWYAAAELWGLAGGASQPLAVGQPSATMAWLGLLVIGLPCTVFALSGVSLLRHWHPDRRSGADSAT